MRVLTITNQFPLPLDMGGPLRFYGLAKALSEAHEVHMLALARPSTTQELVQQMESALGGPVEVFPPRAHQRGFAASAHRWLLAIARGTPPWIDAQYSAELARRARELAPTMDAVVLLDDYAGIYAETVRHAAPVIADKSNVMGWSAARKPGGKSARARMRQALGARLVRRFETRALARADAVVVTSAHESQRLMRLYGRPADAVVPSAIELPAEAAWKRGSRVIGWLGTHEYEPNVEGLVRFVERGWRPLGEDGCRLLIAGREPSPVVRSLERFPGVELVGFVDPLDDFLRQLAAGVVPLWHGPGVKLKTLTFMGAGIPVATTPVGVEGIDAEHGRHCLVADDEHDLANALRAIVNGTALAERLSSHGRSLVADRFTWHSVGPRFVAAVELAAASRA